MTTEIRLPTYARIALSLLALVMFVTVLYYGRSLLTPLAYAAFLAVLLFPVSHALERHKVPRIVAILLTVVLAGIVVAGFTAFIGFQVSQFSDDLPRLKERGAKYFEDLQGFVQSMTGVGFETQVKWLQQGFSKASGGGALGGTFLVFADIAGLLVLIPIYVFLFLLYKDHLLEFLFKVFGRSDSPKVNEVMDEAQLALQGYLIGLMIEMAIIAVLNSIALLLLGVDYAILFGVLAAVLNLIPYIGIFIGSVLPTVMALIMKDSPWYALGVIGAFSLIQFLDNNVIVPRIVASRVSINALMSVIVVIAGGLVWGLSGMFLAIPATAIAKIILDRIPPLEPWGALLGAESVVPRKGAKGRS